MTGLATRGATAKVNLALSITGRRADGYHLLDSLVVFTGFGDTLQAEPAAADSLDLDGPFAGALAGSPQADNLCLKARDGLRALAAARGHEAPGVALRLTKAIPVASGVGGGSADAAAVLHLLCDLWRFTADPDDLAQLALTLGADVPMCLANRPLRASGIGEALTFVDGLPALPMVLVNPGVAVSTPSVFRALESRDNPPLPAIPRLASVRETVAWLGGTRNDLEPPARRLAPAIDGCLDAIRQTGALLARMSGSGATCFGLYAADTEAQAAAAAIASRHPDWFVTATRSLASPA
ncbi:4-diphosphocytidyl-2-C-methyl-D-erythritol kinase [Hoeflea marina]|uniref:4-diphosphocytidyl-2-C-methyl-D-erythritol kinase n=1 Tax=Hoeflea marina TaxID=274592 RepID=A0A317PSC7_9HYPH|nr:4-(cytidine 5'-diphospho)-2-C-methyl-D-erythritol kinase [Hoeflea marina]PWW01794.1 4-diphosphocytidyl-2-C-methyl-D-erythritol kinase [Hoeflea marina]